MNPYRIRYTIQGMPDGYIGNSIKYARDEAEALKHFCGTKPDKKGFFRMKRGGVGRILEVKVDE